MQHSSQEENRLTVLGNRMLTRIPARRRDEITGVWKNCETKIIVIMTLHQMLLEQRNQGQDGRGRLGMSSINMDEMVSEVQLA
jgi:hypothetical protein